MATEIPGAPMGPTAALVKSEELTTLKSEGVDKYTRLLTSKLESLGDKTFKTEEMDIEEEKYLKDRLSQGRSGHFGIGGGEVNLKDPDKLWLALNIIYHKDAANRAYSIIRTAQIKALGGNVPEGWSSEKVHQELLKNPGLLNNFNQRQIFFGKRAAIKLLNDLMAMEEVEEPVQPKEADTNIEIVDLNSGELIKVWQDPSRTPVKLSKIRLGEKSGERLRGSNFTGFVLPTDEADMVCEDRAGFVELSDGTKVFLGADGVGGSYMGSLAAQAVIDIMQGVLSTDGVDHLKIMFEDPEGFVQALGERLKDSQATILKYYQEHYANQSQIIKDVFGAQAQRGSQTTFFVVAISPGGEVRYISLGDGVIEKMAADGSIEDFLPTEKARAPEGVFSTVEGFKGQFRKGAIHLKVGDVLLFGTDGVKHNLKDLQETFKGSNLLLPPTIPQVGDDLTVFVYDQEWQASAQAAETETAETNRISPKIQEILDHTELPAVFE